MRHTGDLPLRLIVRRRVSAVSKERRLGRCAPSPRIRAFTPVFDGLCGER
jgi:hypothetical protein